MIRRRHRRREGRGVSAMSAVAAISARAHWAGGGPIVAATAGSMTPRRSTRSAPAWSACHSCRSARSSSTRWRSSLGRRDHRQEPGQPCLVGFDVGRAINPKMVEGQIEGAFVQGMGFALLEEIGVGRSALSQSVADGLQDAHRDRGPVRALFDHRRVARPDGPFGAKGVGEIGINGVAAAITNAVNRCTGARLRALPLTSERVLTGMLNAEGVR